MGTHRVEACLLPPGHRISRPIQSGHRRALKLAVEVVGGRDARPASSGRHERRKRKRLAGWKPRDEAGATSSSARSVHARRRRPARGESQATVDPAVHANCRSPP